MPLTVTLDVASSSGLDGEAFLVMSMDDDPSWPVLMLPATIANGKLTATLPAVAAPPATQSSSGTGLSPMPMGMSALSPMATPAASLTSGRGTLLGVARFVSLPSKSGKYVVHYQRDFPENMDYATTVAAMLDEADPKIAATGIETSKRTRVDCHIYSFNWFGQIFAIQKNSAGEYPAGFADSELWGSDQVGLNLNSDLLGQAQSVTEVRTTATHELYHVYQGMYDPRGRFSTNNLFSITGLVATTTHAQSYDFKSDSDTGTTFNWQAPDMSGALAVINFKNTTTKWVTGSLLSLTLPVTNSELEGIVYQRISGKVQLVATFKDTMVFQNAEVMAARGDTLYVLLGNGNADRPFTNTHSFQLVAQVTQPNNLAGFNCLSLNYAGTFLVSNNGSTPVNSNNLWAWNPCAAGVSPGGQAIKWSGNTFSVNYDSGPPAYCAFRTVSQIQGQLDPTKTFVTQLTAHLEQDRTNCGSTSTTVEDITFANIPLTNSSAQPPYLTFAMSLSGANVKTHFTYKSTITNSSGVETLTDGPSAQVQIGFATVKQ